LVEVGQVVFVGEIEAVTTVGWVIVTDSILEMGIA
jgi:hypothetical protein